MIRRALDTRGWQWQVDCRLVGRFRKRKPLHPVEEMIAPNCNVLLIPNLQLHLNSLCKAL